MRNSKRLDQMEGDLMRILGLLENLRLQGLRVEDTIKSLSLKLETTIQETLGWSQKIVDSLVEMTLAKSKAPEAAAMHRAQVRLQEKRQNEEPVLPSPTEGVWPPPNSTILRSRG